MEFQILKFAVVFVLILGVFVVWSPCSLPRELPQSQRRWGAGCSRM